MQAISPGTRQRERLKIGVGCEMSAVEMAFGGLLQDLIGVHGTGTFLHRVP